MARMIRVFLIAFFLLSIVVATITTTARQSESDWPALSDTGFNVSQHGHAKIVATPGAAVGGSSRPNSTPTSPSSNFTSKPSFSGYSGNVPDSTTRVSGNHLPPMSSHSSPGVSVLDNDPTDNTTNYHVNVMHKGGGGGGHGGGHGRGGSSGGTRSQGSTSMSVPSCSLLGTVGLVWLLIIAERVVTA